MSDDPDACPKPRLEEACKSLCSKYVVAYQACSKRIEGKADAHCTGQFFDMWQCIDKCVAPRLMPLLK